jgi:hypothetical protein
MGRRSRITLITQDGKLHLIALFHRDATITTLCGYQDQVARHLEAVG